MVEGNFEVSLVIPARNEAATVGSVLAIALRVLPPQSEVIVIDDGSTDGTAAAVTKVAEADPRVRLFRRETNGGKGTAVRDGIALARGRVILFQDADLELDPACLPLLLGPLRGGTGAVYGSRFLDGQVDAPMSIVLANRALTVFTNLLYGTTLSDVATGHRGFRADLLKSLPLRARAFEIESEMTALLAKRGIRIQEVPTRYRPRTSAQGKRIGLRDGWRAAWTLLRLRLNLDVRA